MTKKQNTKKIHLSQGKVTIVDSCNYEYLMQWKWSFHHTGYAVRTIKEKTKTKMIFMHRVINDTTENLYTDHINGDKLDNRKENLRSVTKLQSSQNTSGHKKTSSQYKGVVFNKNLKKWQSQIKINKKQIYIGVFSSEEEAALAYNKFANKYHGEYARLNKVGA